MNVRNCVRCGRIFNYVSGKPLCANCRKDLEEKFKETRTYIKRNPKAVVAEVSEACDVDVKQIKQWVREERLSFSEESAIGIECENCGTSIKTGRFCANCKSTMSNDLKNAFEKEVQPVENPFARDASNRMAFRDSKKK